jgi:uridylate kinase
MIYKRLLLKISGEILMGKQPFGIDQTAALNTATAIKNAYQSGYEIGVVVGGGNIFRGIHLSQLGMSRTPADQMGMLSTLINGIALEQALTSLDCPVKVLSALECPKAVETYQWKNALKYFSTGHVVIFVGGTGNPYFTTDTAAAMRACEIHADILLKATKVDGIYNKDPLQYPEALKYEQMSYSQILSEKLGIMDATAIALCMNNNIPIFVFNMHLLGKRSMSDLLSQTKEGTFVRAIN